MPADLTAVAEANGPARRSDAAAAIAADTSGRLVGFRSLASDSLFTTNVIASKVLTYDAARELSPSSASLVDPWRARREAFEGQWHHGRRFVYGAMNAGGIGADEFGSFCLVVGDPESQTPDALAVFPGDSAERYTTIAAVVDEARATSEATTWADRADLAVTERADEALGCSEGRWPDLLCRPGRYLEVVRAGHLPVSMVSEVRTFVGYREWLDELDARRELENAILSPDHANALDAYDVVQEWSRSLNVILATVPDQETLDG